MEGEGDQRAPRRIHLQSLAAQGDPEAAAYLERLPRCPPLAEYLWAYWKDLNATRPQGFAGVPRITRTEIAQWAADEGVELERWERRTILEVDEAYVHLITGGDPPDDEDEDEDEAAGDD